MKVTLESTTKIVTLNGQRCRIWQGYSARGAPCHAYIPLIAANEGYDTSEFDKELEQHVAPRSDLDVIPWRMVM